MSNFTEMPVTVTIELDGVSSVQLLYILVDPTGRAGTYTVMAPAQEIVANTAQMCLGRTLINLRRRDAEKGGKSY